MKYCGLFISLMILSFTIFSFSGAQTKDKVKYLIVIHGGAGTFEKSFDDSLKEEYFKSLKEALTIGQQILANGGSSLDAVEKVINYFENDPKFNAGIGAVFTSAGTHELDASIMNGKDLSCGAVAGVKHIKNPISLARLVMEKTNHVMLCGEGADEFGREMNVPYVDNSYFDTPQRLKQFEKAKKEKHGTVGCVALDEQGNLAAATSTGGLQNKMPGRIGDSPIIGAGTYANNKTCAISCTGEGELFIRNNIAFNVSALMEYKGMSLKEAADELIYHRLNEDTGGLIAIDKDGNYAMPFNTNGMLRGVADSNALFEVAVWK
ncbi:MAG TPA: isoaspartyl peptidase/L-asparaginase [Ignavibacteriaceae bacterium]|nr:isoaspartyl peptidase/L-asparaginase [Ignavibacteriaceae bacterium]